MATQPDTGSLSNTVWPTVQRNTLTTQRVLLSKYCISRSACGASACKGRLLMVLHLFTGLTQHLPAPSAAETLAGMGGVGPCMLRPLRQADCDNPTKPLSLRTLNNTGFLPVTPALALNKPPSLPFPLQIQPPIQIPVPATHPYSCLQEATISCM